MVDLSFTESRNYTRFMGNQDRIWDALHEEALATAQSEPIFDQGMRNLYWKEIPFQMHCAGVLHLG